MYREEAIEESLYAIPTTARIASNVLIKEFKDRHPIRTNQEIEPILNALFANGKLTDADKMTVYENIVDNIDLYFNLNKIIFVLILDTISSKDLIKNLETLKSNIENAKTWAKLPQSVKSKQPEDMTKTVTEIYFIRYQTTLVRYIDYLVGSVFFVEKEEKKEKKKEKNAKSPKKQKK